MLNKSIRRHGTKYTNYFLIVVQFFNERELNDKHQVKELTSGKAKRRRVYMSF